MLKYAYFLIDPAVTSVMIIQGDGDNHSQSSISGQQQYLKGKNRKNANVVLDRSSRYVTTIVRLASTFWKLINYCSSLKFSHWHAISFFCWVYLICKKFSPEFSINLCGASLCALQIKSLAQSQLWMDPYVLLLTWI